MKVYILWKRPDGAGNRLELDTVYESREDAEIRKSELDGDWFNSWIVSEHDVLHY